MLESVEQPPYNATAQTWTDSNEKVEDISTTLLSQNGQQEMMMRSGIPRGMGAKGFLSGIVNSTMGLFQPTIPLWNPEPSLATLR